MSKAFVTETAAEAAEPPDDAPALPPGVKNYMTPRGHRQMQDELRRLLREERPAVVETVAWAAGNGDRTRKRRLHLWQAPAARDRPAHPLSDERLWHAEVVDPRRQSRRDQVFFGATVTYEGARSGEATVTIVGVDEADLARGEVSWRSPIARALMKARAGDIVELRAPAGAEAIEVLAIRYRDPENETVQRASVPAK